jgi:hypothetical protein
MEEWIEFREEDIYKSNSVEQSYKNPLTKQTLNIFCYNNTLPSRPT